MAIDTVTDRLEDRKALQGQHQLLLRGIANRLEGEFGDLFTRATLDHYVQDSYDELAARSRILNHLPAFVERFARDRMRALARDTGVIDDHRPSVLFVCQRNDAASQMAAALFRHQAGDAAEVHSAGTAPADELLVEAVEVLHEIGLDLVESFPKRLSIEIEKAADVIVTLDSHDDIEIVDGTRHHAWDLGERDGDGIDAYRALRDQLVTSVAGLVASVLPGDGEGGSAHSLAQAPDA